MIHFDMGMFFCQEEKNGISWPLDAVGQDVGSKTTWRLKQNDLRRENRRIGVGVGDAEE